MAARFAGFLSVNGYSSTRLGDTLPTRETELLYPVEQSAVAKAIAAQLPFEVRLTPSPKVQSITLSLGQDAARFDDHLRRSEERRVGQEGGMTCRSRWTQQHYKKNATHRPTRTTDQHARATIKPRAQQ